MNNTAIGFSFRELQYIVAVAEELNFHRAALRCFVSQSTLSIQLKKCEAYLGVVLFTRTQHSVALTPLGVEIVAFAKVALDAADLIKKRTARDRSGAPEPEPMTRQTARHARLRLRRTALDLEDQSRFCLT